MDLDTSAHADRLGIESHWCYAGSFLVIDVEDAQEHAAEGEEEDDGRGDYDAVRDVDFGAEGGGAVDSR